MAKFKNVLSYFRNGKNLMPNLPVCHCGKKPNCFSREEFKGVIIASSYSWARAPGWAGPGSILQGWRNWGSSEGALGAWGSPSDFLGKEVKPVPTKVCAPPYLQIFRQTLPFVVGVVYSIKKFEFYNYLTYYHGFSSRDMFRFVQLQKS